MTNKYYIPKYFVEGLTNKSVLRNLKHASFQKIFVEGNNILYKFSRI